MAYFDTKQHSFDLESRHCNQVSDLIFRLHSLSKHLNIDLSDEISALQLKLAQSSTNKRETSSIRPPIVEDDPSDEYSVRIGLTNVDEFQCSLCLRLLVEPITIPCGHTYCRHCLADCLLKSSKKCPQCRSPCHINPLERKKNTMIDSYIQEHFSSAYIPRIAECKAALAKISSYLPVFFMNRIFFPGTKTSLQFCEPRYHVMVRRAVKGSRVFAYVRSRGLHEPIRRGDFGIIGHVIRYQFLADGRLTVDLQFGKRFRVGSSWIEDATFGLWHCDSIQVRDTPVSVTDLSCTELHEMCLSLERVIDGMREKHGLNLACTDEPLRFTSCSPREITQRGSIEMTEILSQWSLWVAGVFQNVTGTDFSVFDEQLFSTTNVMERLKTLVKICQHVSREFSGENIKDMKMVVDSEEIMGLVAR